MPALGGRPGCRRSCSDTTISAWNHSVLPPRPRQRERQVRFDRHPLGQQLAAKDESRRKDRRVSALSRGPLRWRRLVYELDAGDRGIFFDAIPNVASSRLLDDTAYVKLWTTFDGGGDDGPVAAHDAPPAAEVHEATGG
jgi:hypothetical protein